MNVRLYNGRATNFFARLKRKVFKEKIHIDRWDSYSLNTTLAKAYLATTVCLKQEIKNGNQEVINRLPNIDSRDLGKLGDQQPVATADKKTKWSHLVDFLQQALKEIIEDDIISLAQQKKQDCAIELFVKYILTVKVLTKG